MEEGDAGSRKRKNAEEFDEDRLSLKLSPPVGKPKTPEGSSPAPPGPSGPETSIRSPSPVPTLMDLPYSPLLPLRHHFFPPPVKAPTPSQYPNPAAPSGNPVALRPAPTRVSYARRKRNDGPPAGKDETIQPPFPWATDRRAVVHRKSYLLSQGIRAITGDVKCKRCEHIFCMAYDLAEKFEEVTKFIELEKDSMHDRAAAEWLAPTFPDCLGCGHENCLKPVIAPKKRAINWLFLLLGGTLGCCTIEQLKYFCKHTGNHRTGAKDRLVYLVYLGICKQLEPNILFEVHR